MTGRQRVATVMAAALVGLAAVAPAAAPPASAALPVSPAGTVAPPAGTVPPPAATGPSVAALMRLRDRDAASPEVVATADTASPTRAPVVLQGHGAGSGAGMGQWGAYGYATEQHRTWQWIVEHYYSGTYLEPLSTSVEAEEVDVDLSELDRATTTKVETVKVGAHIEVDGSRRPSEDTVTHTGALKVVTASAGDIAVDLPGIGWRDLQGSLRIEPDGHTWNVVPLEDYVAGVIPAESPASWGSVADGEPSLQAQAVATRSYAVAYVASAGDICDTTTCQVYAGDPADQELGTAAANVTTAAGSTAGDVMCTVATSPCPVSDVALTQFGASSGGVTEASSPFASVTDAGDAVAANPYHTWVAGGDCPTTFAEKTVASDFGLHTLTAARVTQRVGGGAWGGRAVEVVLTGTSASGKAETATVPGYRVVSTLGLCSNWFRFASV